MPERQQSSYQQEEFLRKLVRHGHLIPSGVRGVYGRGSICEVIYGQLDAFLTRFALEDKAEILRFPPLVPRRLLDDVGYTRGFPHLCGAVVGIGIGERHGVDLALEDTESLGVEHTDLALLPAACFPAYPAISLRGVLPSQGSTLDLGAACVYRNEPSDDPTRLQVFHQRELVRIGDQKQVLAWRNNWMDRAAIIYEELQLDATFVVAADPFFGRGGRMLARNQHDAKMKHEAVVPIAGISGTAVMSLNYHGDHLGKVFGLKCADATIAHTACVGFGLERITIAMFDRHGCDLRDWPARLRRRLKLGAY